MKQELFRTLGLNIMISVPESVEEFNKLAGNPDQCLNDAIKNVAYRQAYPEFRKGLCEAVEKETGLARKTKTVGEGESAKEVISEKEAVYIARALSEVEGFTEEKLQAVANDVAKSITLDPTPTERKKKAPKEIVNNAKGVLLAIENGQTTAANFVAAISEDLGVDFIKTYGEVTEESIVNALLAIKAKEERDRQSKYVTA